MSTTQRVHLLTLPAAGDLNDSLYELVTLNADGRVEKTNAAADIPAGIIMEDTGRATVNDDPISVMDLDAGGIGLVKAAAGITRGHVLFPSAAAGQNGRAQGVANVAALADNVMGFGIAMETAAAAGNIIRFKAMRLGPPTT